MNPSPKDLIAPCGMNCALCSRYLSHKNNLRKSHCLGCNSKTDTCTYLFKKCNGINNTSEKKVFCFECTQYPCKEIKRMDKRYTSSYGMSVIDNLEYIKNRGIEKFIIEQYRKYHCRKCGAMVSIHNRKCFNCDTITRLVEKLPDSDL